MSGITQDQRDRFEASLQKMETNADLHSKFLNLPVGSVVQTESGPIKSLSTLANEVEVLGEELGETLVDIATHIDTLAN